MSTSRRKFSKEFKAKVVLESLKERETIESLARKYELQPTQISLWKAQALKNFGSLFATDTPLFSVGYFTNTRSANGSAFFAVKSKAPALHIQRDKKHSTVFDILKFE